MKTEPLKLNVGKDQANSRKTVSRKAEVAALKNIKERDYWLEKFSGNFTKSYFPYDFKRDETNADFLGKLSLELESAVCRELKKLSGGSEYKVHMILTSILVILLGKYTGSHDIITGTPIYKQEVEGEFVNTVLALRNKTADDMTFKDLLLSVRETIFAAVENQNYPIESLLYQLGLPVDDTHFPLFDIALSVDKIHDKNYLTHVRPRMIFSFGGITGSDSISGRLEYSVGLYKEETSRRILGYFVTLLKQTLPDINIKISEIEMLSREEKNQILYECNHTKADWPYDKTIHRLFEEQVDKTPDATALVFGEKYLTYNELEKEANRTAHYLYRAKGIRPEHRVGLLTDKSILCIAAILGIQKAGAAYLPIDPALPEERIVHIVRDADIGVLLSEKKYVKLLNRIQWQCAGLHTFLCLDSPDIYSQEEEENPLMDMKLWEYVGDGAVDDITGGGWKSSYTGEPLSKEEMDEYSVNVYKKLAPLVDGKTRILEIGCATGLTMYRLAPAVAFYFGTDLSPVIIRWNEEQVKKADYKNIKLECLPAHDIHKIGEKDFDLIILNSVIQHFNGHNYLRQVIKKTIHLLKDRGAIFIGDIMDLDKKMALVNELSEFKTANKEKTWRTKTDWSEELFIPKNYFHDLSVDFPEIQAIDISDKIRTIENELTKFRYDALLYVDKTRQPGQPEGKRIKQKYKYQEDTGALACFTEERYPVDVKPGHLVYIIYTSGTTGKPKGVMIEHRNVVRLMVNNSSLFDFDSRDIWTMFHAYNFDFSVWEMYGALLFGGKLLVVSRQQSRDTRRYLQLLKDHQVTILNQTPAAFYNLMAVESERSRRDLNIRYIIFGGEALRPNKLRDWQARYPQVKIVNMYGITETTVHVTYKEIKIEDIHSGVSNVGKPIPTLTTYLMDQNLKPVPPGAVGELCIGGAGVGRGYLGQPEITVEKFVPNPYVEGDRLYRSGDLARKNDIGELEYLGRSDQQVKIRGFRIELEDIENHIRSHEDVKDAVVVAKDDGYGDHFLSAYLVFEGKVEISELKDYLSKKIPEYMIPLYFTALERIPLTANNKVDLKALPEPGILAPGEDFIAPRSEIEKEMTRIWSDVLHVKRELISINSDFFDLGGHSLKATVLISNIHKKLNVKLPLAEIFKTPTVRELSGYIERAAKEKYASIKPVEKKEYYPLSSAQKRIYILQQLDLESVQYNMPQTVAPGKNLGIGKLEEIFNTLVSRHESLRTSFHLIDKEPVQRVIEEAGLKIEFQNERVYSPLEINEKIQTFVRPFDLTAAPLLRIEVLQTSGLEKILLVDMHHIINDGVSHNILTREFLTLLEENKLPPLRLQYKDFSGWQNSDRQIDIIKRQEKYWLERFKEEIPVLHLPADYSRPAVQSFAGRAVAFSVGKEGLKSLESIGRSMNATIFMVVLAAFNILLAKLSNQVEIIVGTPIAGRRHADLENIIGMFVNTLAMKNFPRNEKTFSEFLKELRENTLQAYENQEYQFEELVEKIAVRRDTSRNPVFDVFFNLLNQTDYSGADVPGDNEPEDISEPDTFGYKNRTAKFDMNLMAVETNSGLVFSLEYCTRLFKQETIERYITFFKSILSAIIQNPEVRISEIDMLPGDEKQRILYEFNDREADFPIGKPIHELFADQAKKTPDRTAVIYEDRQLTYGELDEKSGRLAGRIAASAALGTDSILGIMAERSLAMMIGIFGILKVGAAYLPIDPGYPEEWKCFILKDSHADLLLTTPDVHVDSDAMKDMRVDLLFIEDVNIDTASSSSRVSAAGNSAYVIYTSGSTGYPKGVMIGHKSVTNLLIDLQNRYPFNEPDTYLLKTSYMFDVSVTELFGWFLGGGTLALLIPGGEKDPYLILDEIKKRRITHVNFVPSMINAFTEILTPENITKLAGLKYLFLAGEKLQPEHVNKFRYLNSNVNIENLYGPTEAAVYACGYPLSDWSGVKSIPIGRPLRDVKLYILDNGGHLAPIGIAGELCIAGAGLAWGYLNRPELTAEKFVRKAGADISTTPRLIYRTGDIARYLPDGNIEFIGRSDNQVKIRGFRIEPEEIENKLLAHGAVSGAAVVQREDGSGENHLCAYIVSDDKLSTNELKLYLSKELPGYMIPAYFETLEKIPLSPGGKVDRKALPAPKLVIEGEYIPARNSVDKRLVLLWCEILNIEKKRIGIDANFFKLGGHSLRAINVVSRIHKDFDVKIPLVEIFRAPTIRGISDFISKAKRDRYISIKSVEKREYYALSSAQKRLFILQQMEPGSIVYNMPQVLPLNIETGKEKLEEIIKNLIERHESLRTSFIVVEENPVQAVRDFVPFAIEYIKAGDKNIGKIIGDFSAPFDLSRAPLIRMRLVETGSVENILQIDMHHIITDGTSHEILMQDFTAMYEGEELPRLRVQYKEYSEWQNSKEIKESLLLRESYWLNEFSGDLPVLNLPTDYPRPAIQSFAGKTIHFEISPEDYRGLNSVVLGSGATLYMGLLAVFYVLLSKLCGQKDITIGTPSAGRRHADIEKVIGMFVNTLALRNFPIGEKSFKEFLEEVKESTMAAFENQEYQFEDLVGKITVHRDAGRNPLFDLVFNFNTIAEDHIYTTEKEELPGPGALPNEYRDRTAKFDLTLSAFDTGAGLLLALQYCVKLFKEETIRGIIDYFKRVISNVVQNVERKIAGIDILSEAERRELLYRFNDRTTVYSREKTIPELFGDQTIKTPDGLALVGHQEGKRDILSLTYRQLAGDSLKLTGYLFKRGVEPGRMVGIMAERSIEMIIGVLAILKAGCGYVPLNPKSPVSRTRYIMDECRAGLLISGRDIAEQLKEQLFSKPGCGDERAEPVSGELSLPDPGDYAYVIFTSGSTGNPKGVPVSHANLCPLLHWGYEHLKMGSDERVIQNLSYYFDWSVWEIFITLTSGAGLYLVPEEILLDAGKCIAFINRHGITALHVTPTQYGYLLEAEEKPESLLYLFIGAERFPLHLLQRTLESVHDDCRIFNMYGPTEAAIISAVLEIDRTDTGKFEGNSSIPIGKPVANTALLVLDSDKKLCPVSTTGELYIAGDGLAHGYLNDPEKTDSVFSRNIFESAGVGGSFLYKTGDLVRRLPGGDIEFLGRIDQQVKIRGYRIELGEIESQLSKYPQIQEVVVSVKENETGSRYICAYIVNASGEKTGKPEAVKPGSDELKEHLRHRLPDYMIPSYFIYIDKMPLTANGKIDRKKLDSFEAEQGAGYRAPGNDVEEKLLELWSGVLGIEKNKIGTDADFFNLGGHSLNATKLIARIHKELHVNIPLVEIFRFPTIREMGVLISANLLEDKSGLDKENEEVLI